MHFVALVWEEHGASEEAFCEQITIYLRSKSGFLILQIIQDWITIGSLYQHQIMPMGIVSRKQKWGFLYLWFASSAF